MPYTFKEPTEASEMVNDTAHGYNGFLLWAHDSWPDDPLRDARYGSWAAGDCYLLYPGGNSCIRYEKAAGRDCGL